MKASASQALIQFLLQNTKFGRADLISITLLNGQTLNVVFGTNRDIVYGGTRYYCSQYGAWERGAFQNDASFKPNSKSMPLTALIKETVMYPGTTTPLLQVVNMGMLNGASVFIKTLYWPLVGMSGTYAGVAVAYNQANPPAGGFPLGTMNLTQGQIGNVKPAGRSKISCDVYDLVYLLNRQVPPHNIQSSCRHILFDAGCTLLASLFTSTNVPLAANSSNLFLNLNIPARANGTAYVRGNLILVAGVIYMCTTAGTSAGSAPTFNATRGTVTADGSTLKWTSMNQAYPLGYVSFNGGQNSGLKATVKTQSYASGVLTVQLLKPLPFPVATGDTLVLVPGCDKTMGTCLNAFNNLIHFGGQPFVPNAEVAQ